MADPKLNLSDSQKQQIQDAFSNLKNSIIAKIDEFDTQITTVLQLNENPNISSPNEPLSSTESIPTQMPSNLINEEIQERQAQASDLQLDDSVPQSNPSLNIDLDTSKLSQEFQKSQTVNPNLAQPTPEPNLNLNTPTPTPINPVPLTQTPPQPDNLTTPITPTQPQPNPQLNTTDTNTI